MKKVASQENRPQQVLPPIRTGSYLITGGLGMLGRQAAKWLADNGAKQIVLVSRRTPDEATAGIPGHDQQRNGLRDRRAFGRFGLPERCRKTV